MNFVINEIAWLKFEGSYYYK